MNQVVSRTKRHHEELLTLGAAVPSIVAFEVGGRQLSVEKHLLEKDPQSLLFVLADRQYSTPDDRRAKKRRTDNDQLGAAPQTSSSGRAAISIPEKDPDILARLLNVVRGYKSAVNGRGWKEACEQDVAFYGLQKSWEALFPSEENPQFAIKMHPSCISSALVCGVAGPYHAYGRHVVTFAVTLQGPEKIAVGVEAKDQNEDSNSMSHATRGEAYNRALYWNDGSITTYFNVSKSMTSGFPYKSSAIIKIVLDADEGTLHWMTTASDCVAMIRLPKRKSGYAFCALSQKGSQINIVGTG